MTKTGMPPCLAGPARAASGLQLLRVGSDWAGIPYVSARVASDIAHAGQHKEPCLVARVMHAGLDPAEGGRRRARARHA